MNCPSFARSSRLMTSTCLILSLALLFIVLMTACGGDHETSQDAASEFGAVPTYEVETSEESPASDVARTIVGGLLRGIWIVVCSLLGSWWSLLVVPLGTFLWVLQKKSEHHGLRYAASNGVIWSLLAAAATLIVILLCWIF